MIDLAPLLPSLQGRPVAILGLGQSGLSVLAACKAAGIETVLWDDAPEKRAAAEAEGGRTEDLANADFTRFSLLCVSPGIPLSYPAPHAAVTLARAAGVEVLGDIELFHRALPSARTVGITGTNGKSTTTALIGHILRAAGVPVAIGGNIGTPALSLPVLPQQGLYVFELSSYQLDLCPTFAPDISVLVNIGPDHLDRHGGMEGYAAAKARIFRGKGAGIVSLDDPWSAEIYGSVANSAREDVPVSVVSPLAEGVCVTDKGILREHARDIADLAKCRALRGVHNWQNAAMAYAAARAAGLPAERIVPALGSFSGLAHRQKVVAVIGGISYVNDSKATNDQAAAVALAAYDPVYWIAGGKSKGGGYTECLRHAGHIRHAFLIGAAEAELAVALSAEGVAFTRCGTLESALAGAHALAQTEMLDGAAVLLSPACASFDQFRNFEHRGDVFAALVAALPDAGKAKATGGGK